MTIARIAFFSAISWLLPVVNGQNVNQGNSSVCLLNAPVDLGNNLFLSHAYNPMDNTVAFEMVYEGEAWVSFGFGTTMIGSTAIIGLPDDNSTPGLHYLDSTAIIPIEDSPGVVSSSVSQEAGRTTLEFTMSMHVFNETVVNGENSIIYAVGADNILAYHPFSGVSMLTILPCADSSAPSMQEDEVCGLSDAIDLGDNVMLRQSYNPEANTVSFEVTYAGEAWVGFGFGTTMVGSTAVIGLPDDTAPPGFHYLASDAIIPVEGSPGLVSSSVIQEAGQTTLMFTLSLEYFNETVIDGENSMIYGVGSDNTLGYHPFSGVRQVTITECGAPPPVVEVCGLSDGIDLGDNVMLRQSYNPEENTVSFVVTYAGEAWVGFGFGTTMVGSTAVIGLPDDPAAPGFHYLASNAIIPVEGSPGLVSSSVIQEAGQTTLMFTLSLEYFNETVIDGENSMIYGVGSDNTLGYHPFSGVRQVTITECGAPPVASVCALNAAVDLGDNVMLRQAMNMEDNTISFEIVYDGEAWVSLGFGTTMIGSTAVIGLPESDEAPGLHYLASDAIIPVEGSPGLLSSSVVQQGGRTTLSYTLSVDVFNETVVNGENSMIYAVGSDNVLAYHPFSGVRMVTINPCAPVIPDESVCALNAFVDLGNGIMFRQAVFEEGNTVSFEIVYDGEAWVGFGFGTQMVGSTVVIGLPDSDSPPGFHYLASDAVVPVEGSPGLVGSSVVQESGQTVLSFTLSLDTFDNVSVDGEYSMIYAVGSDNTLAYHPFSGVRMVKMLACASDDVPDLDEDEEDTAPTAAPTEVVVSGNEFLLEGGLVSVSVDTDMEAETLTVEMVYEGQAWISFGFSENGGMVGSTAVIALPDEPVGPSNPGLYFMSGRSQSAVQLLPEDRQTLIGASMSQDEFRTVLTFTKKFVEEGIVDIDPLGVNDFIYAYGSSNLLGMHPSRNGIKMDLSNLEGGIEVGPTPKRELWIAHGVLMAVGWGVMIPLGVGASLIRGLLPFAPGTWFQIHQGINSMAVLFVIISLALAIRAVNEETPDGVDPDHFTTDEKHRAIGFVIVLFAFLQVLSGLFRPHAPHKPKPVDEKDGEESPEQPEKEEEHHEEGKTTIRFLWEIQHRVMGAALLGLSWYNVDEGLRLFALLFQEDEITGAFWGVVGGLSGLIAIGYVVQAIQKN